MAEVATQQQEAPGVRRAWWRDRRRLLGVLVVGLVVCYLLYASWVGPRMSTPSALHHPGTNGWVVTTTAPERVSADVWRSSDDELRPDPQGAVVVWRSDDRLSWTALSPDDPALARLRAQPQLDPESVRAPMERVRHLTTGIGLLTLLTVLCGPQPRVGNRWYWFWMAQIPLGLGALYLARTELLRDPAARSRRRSGLDGAATAVLAYFAVDAALWLASGL